MKLTVIGASGHGKVAADIAVKCGYDIIEFLDDSPDVKTCGKWQVVGKTAAAENIENDIFVAIGNAKTRRAMTERFSDKSFATLIHPSAVIADDAKIGAGSVVMAGAVVNPGAAVGKGCIINTCSSVDHDCVIGDFCHISVGAHLAGTVTAGEETWVGAGATVSNNVDICGGCMIGAGAVVVKNIDAPGTYVGVPAKKIK